MQGTNQEEVLEIDLGELFGLLLHRILPISICGLVLGVVAFAISMFVLVPQYESTTKVYILNKQTNNTITYSDTQLATQLTKDYGELIASRYVLERVIAEQGLDSTYEGLKARVRVENTRDTRIIGITVKDSDPVRAQYIANAIRDVSAEHIKTVMDIEAVNIVDKANLPKEPVEPSVMKWTAMGVILGAVGCIAFVVIKFMLDDTIKYSEDIEKYLGLSTLALIPVMQGEGQDKTNSGKKKIR